MKYFWLIVFTALSAGVILSPAFPLTSLVLLLLLFKKKSLTFFAIFLFLGSFLAAVHTVSGTHEVVGYAKIERSSYVIATDVKIFSDDEWKSLLHNLKLYSKEVKAGETFYASGKIEFRFAYPPLTMKPTFSAGTKFGNRGFEKVHSKLIGFKRKIIEFFQNNAPSCSEL
ncbi:MAG TPA: hypothetical protein DEA64_06390, partial [Pseudothermotoga sp.]|nr:hypothetical protein [Pseudothermotoga sp.]